MINICMKPSAELINTPVSPIKEDQKCLQCGHDCHCGDACSDKTCFCGVCVHNPDYVVDKEPT
jgi:hypothetical protein